MHHIHSHKHAFMRWGRHTHSTYNIYRIHTLTRQSAHARRTFRTKPMARTHRLSAPPPRMAPFSRRFSRRGDCWLHAAADARRSQRACTPPRALVSCEIRCMYYKHTLIPTNTYESHLSRHSIHYMIRRHFTFLTYTLFHLLSPDLYSFAHTYTLGDLTYCFTYTFTVDHNSFQFLWGTEMRRGLFPSGLLSDSRERVCVSCDVCPRC